jgi:hypothetical protein
MDSSFLHKIEINHFWRDFHVTFLNYWRESLADHLPPEYDANIEEQVNIIYSNETARRLGPNVSIVRSTTEGYACNNDAGTTTVCLEHLSIEEEVRTHHIEIIHRPDRRLVAWLEVLSPTNKEEPGYSRYLAKRNELLSQPFHLVELDLLLAGNRLPHRQPLPEADYYTIVSRVEDRLHCVVTAWKQSSPLPTIAIPLLGKDEFIRSPLQSVFETAFERGRYAKKMSRQ